MKHSFNLILCIFSIIMLISCNKENEKVYPKPVVQIDIDTNRVYPMDFIFFNAICENFPVELTWHFEGGTPEFLTEERVSEFHPLSHPIRYDTPGNYSVSITAKNKGGEITINKEGYITVLEETRPLIYGHLSGVTQAVTSVTLYEKNLTNVIRLGWTTSIDNNYNFELRIPTDYLGKRMDLFCNITDGDGISSYESFTVNALIEQENHLTFPTSKK